MIDLTKGQAIDLSKETAGKKFELRCSWDESRIEEVDVDILCVLCDSNKKGIYPDDPRTLVFYKNLSSEDGSIVHQGDNRTGSGEGWDEIINVDFEKMTGKIQNVQVLLNIHDARTKAQNFGMVKNVKAQIFDVENNKAIAEYVPDLTNSTDTCVVLGEFIKRDSSFYYKALGIGSERGLGEVLSDYGILAK